MKKLYALNIIWIIIYLLRIESKIKRKCYLYKVCCIKHLKSNY